MFRGTCIVVTVLFIGCAAPHPVAVTTSASPQPTGPASATKMVETRYEVRGYREATNPQIRHEAHAVYRSTRVPVAAGDELATIPRASYPMSSYTPLPASEELAMELAMQKSITAEMRIIQTSMVETERRVQSQYAKLVRESAEALKVREQLEAERARAQVEVPPAPSAASVVPPAGGTAEVKW